MIAIARACASTRAHAANVSSEGRRGASSHAREGSIHASYRMVPARACRGAHVCTSGDSGILRAWQGGSRRRGGEGLLVGVGGFGGGGGGVCVW